MNPDPRTASSLRALATTAFLVLASLIMVPPTAADSHEECQGSPAVCTVQEAIGLEEGECEGGYCLDPCRGTGAVYACVIHEECDDGELVYIHARGQGQCYKGEVEPCEDGWGYRVDGQGPCVDLSGCPAGFTGATVQGNLVCVRECPGATVGVEAYGGPTTCEPIVESCSGLDSGLVVAGVPVCVRLCPSSSGVGVVVNGDPTCVSAGLCPSGTYGVMVNGDPSGCHTVAPCPSPKTGYMVDGNQATCIGPVAPPTVGLCPSGSYGVLVNGNPTPACFTVTECAGDPVGYTVTPGASTGCHTVETCPAGSVGLRVDGIGDCVELPVEDCPPGRQGIVVNGNEICPIAG